MENKTQEIIPRNLSTPLRRAAPQWASAPPGAGNTYPHIGAGTVCLRLWEGRRCGGGCRMRGVGMGGRRVGHCGLVSTWADVRMKGTLTMERALRDCLLSWPF